MFSLKELLSLRLPLNDVMSEEDPVREPTCCIDPRLTRSADADCLARNEIPHDLGSAVAR
jgi:hypothetical protein